MTDVQLHDVVRDTKLRKVSENCLHERLSRKNQYLLNNKMKAWEVVDRREGDKKVAIRNVSRGGWGEKKGVSAASAVWPHQEILTSGGKQFLGHLVETSFHVGKLLTFQSGNISHAWHPGLSTEPTQTPYCPSPSYWLPPKAKFLASMVPI